MSYYVAPPLSPYLSNWLPMSRKWHFIFGGFLHNHLAHNFVVMGCSGLDDAESNEKMKWWNDFYENKTESLTGTPLETAHPVTPDMPAITSESWKDHIRMDNYELYPAYLQYFDEQISSLGRETVIQQHVPYLLYGIAGSALHPIIHLGYALDAQHDGMTAEGLASLCCGFMSLSCAPMTENLWTENEDSKGIIDSAISFLSTAKNCNFYSIAKDAGKTTRYMEQPIGSFQRKVWAFDDPSLPLGAELNSICPIRMPIVNESITPSVKEATALAAAAYVASDCEFFTLHGLTSLHGLLATLPLLSPRHQRTAIILWLRATLATIVVVDCPGSEKLLGILQRWKESEETAPEPSETTPVEEAWWKDAITKALTSTDEHAPKAVYALWRWSVFNDMPEHSHVLFREAAVNQIRPVEGGGPEKLIWADRSE
mmetsp:Transcript_428/g.812  ORF Transcript_428/g.812 Transcript_428/m.812 type:complete len:428 (-) Transcript_428:167-1450(-)